MQFVDVVVGGQYGSEAKGHVTAQLVRSAIAAARRPDAPQNPTTEVINIRVAGPNAGHTAYDDQGRKFAFRSLPVGAVIDPEVTLYIAPGSEIDLKVLRDEIEIAEAAGHAVKHRLYVSRQATVIEDRHKETEATKDLVGRVGSTGKGIGAARAEHIMRNAAIMADLFSCDDGDADAVGWTWAEPEDLYATDRHAHELSQHIIIEGTQGYGLSLRASGHYPQVTSSDCRAIDFLAMAGIDPTRYSTRVTNWVVARVYPIRVAGNSGPMKGETSWEALGLEAERTTVTQKVRRVGDWDADLLARAVQANGGHQAKVVITMLDQVVPELVDDLHRVRDILAKVNDDSDGYAGDAKEFPASVQAATDWVKEHASRELIGAHVAGITFSPTDILWTRHARRRRGGIGGTLEEILGGLSL